MDAQTRRSLQDMSTLEKVERLQNMMVSRATGGSPDDEEYKLVRRMLITNDEIKSDLPRFVRTCGDVSQFWGFIKPKLDSYQERREFIWKAFAPLIRRLEGLEAPGAPHDDAITALIEDFDAAHVGLAWEKALKRRHDDPEAALTSARTLLETVCKHILDETGTPYDDTANLPALYNRTAKQLNLSPGQHKEDVFKRILGSCHQIVQGLGSIRNTLSDAHGRSGNAPAPSARHASLGVNLAGAAAEFLVATYQEKGPKNTDDVFDR